MTILYLLLGIASIAYYFIIGTYSRFGLSLSELWLALGGVFLLSAALCRSKRIPQLIHTLWRAGLCAALIAMVALILPVLTQLHAAAPAGMDYLVVLGARVDPDGPSPALTRRLNCVMDVIGDHPDAVIVATGGQGADEPMSEAQCIRDELIRRGVDGARIVMEDKSTSTEQNLQNALAIIGDADAAVGIITNNYHVYRAMRIARRTGFRNAHGIAAIYTGPTKPHFIVREAFALAAGLVKGTL